MTRQADIQQFYKLLDELERRLHGTRLLGKCNGSMAWPGRGVYYFFEPGELREGKQSCRIVRVGTHGLKPNAKSTLWDRLIQHKGTVNGSRPNGGNHRGSVFRRHVGSALI